MQPVDLIIMCIAQCCYQPDNHTFIREFCKSLYFVSKGSHKVDILYIKE